MYFLTLPSLLHPSILLFFFYTCSSSGARIQWLLVYSQFLFLIYGIQKYPQALSSTLRMLSPWAFRSLKCTDPLELIFSYTYYSMYNLNLTICTCTQLLYLNFDGQLMNKILQFLYIFHCCRMISLSLWESRTITVIA